MYISPRLRITLNVTRQRQTHRHTSRERERERERETMREREKEERYFGEVEGADCVGGQLDDVNQRHFDPSVQLRATARPVLITLALYTHTTRARHVQTDINSRPTPLN